MRTLLHWAACQIQTSLGAQNAQNTGKNNHGINKGLLVRDKDHIGTVEEGNKAHNFHVTPTYCVSLLVHHGGQVFDDLVHIQHVTLKKTEIPTLMRNGEISKHKRHVQHFQPGKEKRKPRNLHQCRSKRGKL